MRLVRVKSLFFVLLLQSALFSFYGCDAGQKSGSPKLTTEYQAVFLDNGQVFFGKLSALDAQYLQLNDVYYVRSEADKETKEVRSILIKRGNEWHGPDAMYINTDHVTLIEPVTPSSKVGELIKEAVKKSGNEK